MFRNNGPKLGITRNARQEKVGKWLPFSQLSVLGFKCLASEEKEALEAQRLLFLAQETKPFLAMLQV